MQTMFTTSRRVLLALGSTTCLTLLAWTTPLSATERLVIAMSPPTVESNLLWQSGLGEPMPWMQTLVGNDPVTGKYDDSGLARSWEANDDYTEWTFHLHPEAAFHFNWGPVTAADVVHSYGLHTGPEATYTGAEHILAREVEAIDDHTVVFRFDEPKTDYAFEHAGRGRMVVYSKAQYDAEGVEGYHSRPAGSGPFEFVERRPGEGTSFRRTENHWQGSDAGFAEIELRWVAEPSTKLAMTLAGEAHITDIPRELHEDATAAGKVVVASQNPAMHTSMSFAGLYMRTDDPAKRLDLPWADVRIREAMNRAIDREQMIEILYGPNAEPLARYGMHPPHEGYVPELEARFEAEYGYDPARAKELLAEAGYPEAFPDPVVPILSTIAAGNSEWPTMAELIQVFFHEVGIEAEIREMDMATWAAQSRGREAYYLGPIRNAPIRPSEIVLQTFYTTGGSPYGGYESDTIEALTAELERTLDPERRDRLAAEAFTYLFEQYSDMPMAARRAEVVVDPTVVGDWVFPGVTTNSLSHFELITPAT